MIDLLIAELNTEAISTRKLISSIPSDNLSWSPHPKSMSIGALGKHIAESQGAVCDILAVDVFDANEINTSFEEGPSTEEMLQIFDEGIEKANAYLRTVTEEQLAKSWKLTKADQVIYEVPRAAAIKSFLLSHTYHHRGQLSVYLRLLDIPVPSVYGATADDNPFK